MFLHRFILPIQLFAFLKHLELLTFQWALIQNYGNCNQGFKPKCRLLHFALLSWLTKHCKCNLESLSLPLKNTFLLYSPL